MGLREELGGKIEAVLNKLVDEKLKTLDIAVIKAEVHKHTDALLDGYVAGVLDGLGEKIKKDVIDLIDGEDDIK